MTEPCVFEATSNNPVPRKQRWKSWNKGFYPFCNVTEALIGWNPDNMDLYWVMLTSSDQYKSHDLYWNLVFPTSGSCRCKYEIPIRVTWLVLAKLIMFVMKMCHKHANIWMEKDSGFIECRAISVNLYRIQVSVTIQTLKKELPASEFPEEVANCFALCSWLNLAESSFCRVLTFDKPGTTRGFWKKEFHKYTN